MKDDAVQSEQQRGIRAHDVSELGLAFSDVVILFACNDHFAPYLSVALQSVVEHVNPSRCYDIVVMTDDISQKTANTLANQVESGSKGVAHIGFLLMEGALDGLQPRTHGHFRPQMYYRLLAPQLMPGIHKVLYLDSDLVVLEDVATLFDTDVEGHLLAATQDADTIGQAGGYDATVKYYIRDTLKLPSVLDYFQSGVLVLNLDEFRAHHPSQELIAKANERLWRWPDQDVLNMAANGDYVRLDMRWDSLFDWAGNRRKRIIRRAPERVQAEYDAAHAHPAIVHYAGPDYRPWVYPKCDGGDLFWDFAARCPYVDELHRRLEESRHTARGRLKRLQVFVLYRVGQNFFDIVCYAGFGYRTAVIACFRAIGGGRII